MTPEAVIRSFQNYRRAGIRIEIIDGSLEDGEIKVKITQERLINGYILNQQQLIERVGEIFKDVITPNVFLLVHVIPVVYSLDVNEIDISWIESRMDEFGVQRKDLIKQLAIDKSSLSLILSGKRELSKPMRALFFYYFLSYELNRDLRQELSSNE